MQFTLLKYPYEVIILNDETLKGWITINYSENRKTWIINESPNEKYNWSELLVISCDL